MEKKEDVDYWVDMMSRHEQDKHIGENKDFNSIDEREQITRETLIDKDTLYYNGANDRELYYNKDRNVGCVVNNEFPEKSTSFRPDSGREWLEENHDRDSIRLSGQGKEINEIQSGGFYGCHQAELSEQEQEKKEELSLADRKEKLLQQGPKDPTPAAEEEQIEEKCRSR